MANRSDLTRRDQVRAYLHARLNQWVDGTDLANEEVGGSEGLKRLRELRTELEAEGRYAIEMRPHPSPDRAIFQYRMTEVWPVEPNGPPPKTDVPMVKPTDSRPSRVGGGIAYDAETGQFIALVDSAPPPVEEPPPVATGQTDMGVPEAPLHRFTKKPEKYGLGLTVPCPRCKNLHRAIKEKDPVTGKASKHGKVIGYEDFTRDPHKPSRECERCGGFGVVPPQ